MILRGTCKFENTPKWALQYWSWQIDQKWALIWWSCLRSHTSNQPKSPNVLYVTHMDPLSYQPKFGVMQPPWALVIKPPIFQFLYYRPQKWRSCSEDTRRLHDLKLCQAIKWVHVSNIWNIWTFGLIGSMISQKWPQNRQFYQYSLLHKL